MSPGSVRVTPFVLAACLAHPPLAGAHGPLDEQIAGITARIEAEPGDPSLRLRRGELHRAHGDRPAALADQRCALEIDPAFDAARLALATLALETGRFDDAIAEARLFLERHPASLRAMRVEAEALARLGRAAEALAVEERLVAVAAVTGGLLPDDLLRRARTAAAAPGGDLSRVVAGLDEGRTLLGNAVVLDLEALRLEERAGWIEAAAARLDRLAATAERPGPWLARKAELLGRAGRIDDARRARDAADRAFASEPGAVAARSAGTIGATSGGAPR